MGLFSFLNKAEKIKPEINQEKKPEAPKYRISSVKKENDEMYRKLSNSSMEHMKSGELGLYRNDLLKMTEIIEKEGNTKDALGLYLTIFYIDLSGIDSLSSMNMGLKPHPTVAPGIIKRIKSLKNKLKISDDELKELYFSLNLETSVPDTQFSYSESYDLLSVCLSDGCDSAEPIIKKKMKKYKSK